MPRECVDASDPLDVDPSEVIKGRLGFPTSGRCSPRLGRGHLLGLIEVFHDLVARPRARWYHSWNDCGWHYRDYSTDTGRASYRWRVNRLLAEHGSSCVWPSDGEDEGRLVQVVDDARADLIDAPCTSRRPASPTGSPMRSPCSAAVTPPSTTSARQPSRSRSCSRSAASCSRRALFTSRRERPVPHRQRVRPAPPRGQAAQRLRPGVPGLDVLVVPGHHRAHRPDPRSHRQRSDSLVTDRARAGAPAGRPAGAGSGAAADRGRGRLRRGGPGSEHAARLPLGLVGVHHLVLAREARPAAGGCSHHQQLPDRAGPGRREGRHHQPAAVGHPVRPPAARPARPDHRRPGGRGVGGHPAHPRRATRTGRPADAARAARRARRVPDHQDLEGPGPAG